MNSYRFRPKPTFQSYGTKTQQRLVVLALALAILAAVLLGLAYARAQVFENKAKAQFESRINSNLVDAIGQVSRMPGTVQSNSSIKLGQIRQHIFAIEQINTISIGVRGEAGRLVPQEALDALFDTLDRYEVAVQTATGNTLELRTLMLTYLMSLKEVLDQE